MTTSSSLNGPQRRLTTASLFGPRRPCTPNLSPLSGSSQHSLTILVSALVWMVRLHLAGLAGSIPSEGMRPTTATGHRPVDTADPSAGRVGYSPPSPSRH